ncbi:MAG: DEAD/DEAH box helicase family protein [Ruminococcus sp.]|uniref:DUF4145 domain-containing protein n=1 Tax=Schaedlerella arabinosiphila TaxID=2044587 RepID=A0A3R8JRK8_9FIRM|nr:DEAD/DEAH box helicase family protein [Schaedlerella arabinosiphila]MCI8723972.1 DEAD/DEAH box helicase family protein [Ruminococcus sp.]RRK34499.1 DUF4145 domain-containing protein [Schaedlerella arabinosiphila]
MSTNFDFLTAAPAFSSFSTQAIEAEKSLVISPATSAILSRRALELAVRWVYVSDDGLKLPYRDNLSALIHEETFRDILEPRLFPMLKYTVRLGNTAVHTNQKIKRDDAILSLRNLFEFCKWIEYCYSTQYQDYEDAVYDESLLESAVSAEIRRETQPRPEELQELYAKLGSRDKKLEEIRLENESLRVEMTKLREKNTTENTFQVDAFTEAQTRRKYIDIELMDAGWRIGTDCREEVTISGMPTPTETGRADYVLFGDNGLPLAVIEAKKTGTDPIAGSRQAKLYADCLEKEYHQRPFIFTTNGFEIEFTDDYGQYPRRRVSGFFTKKELQLNMDRRRSRKPLDTIEINDQITNRPYQKEAVAAVCDAIRKKHRRMLIVQATGSGKTRVSISLVDVLRRHNYVKNILFLADRKALVRQAKKSYGNLLPDLTLCSLLDNKDDPEQSRMIFSTYPTMMNAIDETQGKEGGRLFTPGHFDLIIVDESHRSIYKKYQDIFEYFDGMLLGMTATPKEEIDRNTYSIFDLERGVPTFAYELDQAVEEGYLVDYSTKEYKTKIMEEGIHYDQLSEEEKEEFEETFGDDETIDKDISENAVNEWLFNEDTICRVLSALMENGLKVEGGDKLGKTIIFAKNSPHAKAIVDCFQKYYPEYGSDFICQIDYSISYADTLIDDFSTKDRLPQIAVSVDMLDTGIDIPEILNLVFFKKVRSCSKFWQMIGRGTRLCKDLFGPGMDKEAFLIFDFCSNFEYFRANKKGKETKAQEAPAEKIFNCKVHIARELQAPQFQREEKYAQYRADLVNGLNGQVAELNDGSWRVRQHLRYVEAYREKSAWQNLETASVSELKEHIAPLIVPGCEDELARRFDYLLLSMELSLLQSKNMTRNMGVVMQTADQLSRLYTIPQVRAKQSVIERALSEEFWEHAGILDMELVREALRGLLKFIEKQRTAIYYTDFEDHIIEEKEGGAIYISHDLKNYRKKVEYYLKEHKDHLAVYKLRRNKRLTAEEFAELERILWEELGTKEEYQKEYGETPVGRLVRKIVGVDREVVNAAFSAFMGEEKLNLNQMRFVRLMMDYITVNGNIEDNQVLMRDPFRSVGSITALFRDDLSVAQEIMKVAEDFRKNSEVTA